MSATFELSALLVQLEDSLKKRNSLLALKYLNTGLPEKLANKRFGKLKGYTTPLHELYTWHDGTEFVNLEPGETYDDGIAKVSFFPHDVFLFIDSQQAIAMMDTWAQAAKRNSVLREGIGRYFPIFGGANAKFLFDMHPESKGRILFFSNSGDSYYQEAYKNVAEFVVDIINANERNVRLSFMSERANARRWP